MELVNVFYDDWEMKEKWRDGDKVEIKASKFVNYFYEAP